MTIARNPCYRCPSGDPRWRSPRLGWLCLTCFAEKTEPSVRVAPTDSPSDVGPRTKEVAVAREGDGSTWTLLVYQPGTDDPAETYPLGTEIDAEEAVDEAKWILEKRSRERRHTA